MPAFGFKNRFAQPIEQGIKRQTIRADRKDKRRPAKPGDTLTLYTGMRTKHCRKLAIVRCTFCAPLRLDRDGDGPAVTIGDRSLSAHEIEALAYDDAFRSTDEFVAFFEAEHGLPFAGWIIKWEPIPEADHGR